MKFRDTNCLYGQRSSVNCQLTSQCFRAPSPCFLAKSAGVCIRLVLAAMARCCLRDPKLGMVTVGKNQGFHGIS